MNSKKIISLIVLIILLLLAIGLFIYPYTRKTAITNYTKECIYTYGYNDNDIKDIDIYHSYINKILGYNEWRIEVCFNNIPSIDSNDTSITFWFSYRDNKIIYEGVRIYPLSDNKDLYMYYSDKFKNGTLFDGEIIE